MSNKEFVLSVFDKNTPSNLVVENILSRTGLDLSLIHISEKAEWKNLSDIKVDFLSADYVGNQHYVFNIRGNNYRLV